MMPVYTKVSLREKQKNGSKWIFGPFVPEHVAEHTKLIGLGYVDLERVAETDSLHYHTDSEEYYIVLSGAMSIQVGGELVKVSEDEILLVRPGIPHLIIDVQSGTRIVLIKVPPHSDKVVVS